MKRQVRNLLHLAFNDARRFYEAARGDGCGVAFCFMLSTGMHMDEVLGLRWENIDLRSDLFDVDAALVSLNGHLHRHTPKSARSKSTLEVSGDALKFLRERHGWPPYKGTHMLRHSFISIQSQQGLPAEVIRDHVGHAQASFTQEHRRRAFAHECKGLTLDFSAQVKDIETDS